MTRPLLEVCVDSHASAMAAIRGGAHRIELCAALSEGGLTPSAGWLREAAQWPVPVYAMIRPRAGDFVFAAAESAIMERDIATVRAAGLAGVVIGGRRSEGGLDTPLIDRLVRAARPLRVTLHRVVDNLPDPVAAVDLAADLGIDRILTSGGAPTAPDGVATIRKMIDRAAGRITIMPGAGLTPENIPHVVTATGAREVHGSFAPKTASGPRVTSEETVRRAVAALMA